MEGDSYNPCGKHGIGDILVLHVMASQPFPWQFQDEDHFVDQQDYRCFGSNNRHSLAGTGTFQCHFPGHADNLIQLWKNLKFISLI